MDKWEGGIGIGGTVEKKLRYADDTTLKLIAGTKEDLIEIMERVGKQPMKGTYNLVNVLKTKVMTTGDI